MRRVVTIEDVNAALRELFQFRDALLTANVDWHQRRIINAAPSVADYDYVVRKELRDLLGTFKTPRAVITQSGPGYDKITFGIGVATPAVVGDYVTPPYVWSNPKNGRPQAIFLCANVPPLGGDFRVDIKKNGISIFSAGFVTLPDFTPARFVVTYAGVFTSGLQFSRRDVVTAHVLSVGAVNAGQDVQVTIFCTLV